MRVDLPSMGAGRAAAQASHAANAFIHGNGAMPSVLDWQSQTAQGFGTAIVLGATLDQIKNKMALAKGFLNDTVVDPDYVISVSSELIPVIKMDSRTQFVPSETDPTKYLYHRSEVTCAYIFGDKELLKSILGDLPLYS